MHNAVNLFRDLFNGNTYGGGTGDYQLRVDGLPRPSWAAKALSERRRSSWRFLLAWERQRGRRSPGRLIVHRILRSSAVWTRPLRTSRAREDHPHGTNG